MDNKKQIELTLASLPQEDVDALMNKIIEATNKHTDEKLAQIDNKAVAVQASDVNKAVEEVLSKKEATVKTAPEAKKEDVKTAKVEVVNDVKEEDEFKLSPLGVLKFALVGAAGIGAGWFGKTIYDDHKAKKAAKAEYIDASYDVSTADYN